MAGPTPTVLFTSGALPRGSPWLAECPVAVPWTGTSVGAVGRVSHCVDM